MDKMMYAIYKKVTVTYTRCLVEGNSIGEAIEKYTKVEGIGDIVWHEDKEEYIAEPRRHCEACAAIYKQRYVAQGRDVDVLRSCIDCDCKILPNELLSDLEEGKLTLKDC
jgi:hypothetical protein